MSLEACTIKINNEIGRIKRVKEFIEANPPDASSSIAGKYTIRLDVLTTSYKEYQKHHDEITLLNSVNKADKAIVAKHLESSIQMEEIVFDLREQLESIILVLSNPTHITHQGEHVILGGRAEIRLPPLTITSFSGDYNEWTSFYDLFLCTVHNNLSLKKVQKMQYLKSLLKEEALQLIKHLPVNDINYNIAWEKLITRYDKKAHIVQQLIKKFIDQSIVTKSHFNELRSLTNNSLEIIRSLATLESEGRDPWIIYILVSRLDSETRQLWATKVIEESKSTLEDFFKFLEDRCDALETICPVKDQMAIKSYHVKLQSTNSRKKSSGRPSSQSSEYSSSSSLNPAQSLNAGNSHGEIICPLCKDDSHYLHKCKTFKDWNVTSRWNYVRDKHICFNCLFRNHTTKECPMNFVCQVCKQRHHSLLHGDESRSSKATSSLFGTCHYTSNDSVVRGILPTAVVNCRDVSGNLKPIRVIIDTGSENSFITETCMELLGLHREKAHLSVTGISGSDAGSTRGKTRLNLSSRFDENQSVTLDAYILLNITKQIPEEPIDVRDWKFVKGIQMADPDFQTPNNVDVIIGASTAFSLLGRQRIIGSNSSKIAQSTIFGFIMTGEQKVSNRHGSTNFHLKVHHEQLSPEVVVQHESTVVEKVRCFSQQSRKDSIPSDTQSKSSHRDVKPNYVNQEIRFLTFGFLWLCINSFFLFQVILSPASVNAPSYFLTGAYVVCLLAALIIFVKMSLHGRWKFDVTWTQVYMDYGDEQDK